MRKQKLLLHEWKSFLEEAMIGPEGLPEGVKIYGKKEAPDLMTFFYGQPDKNRIRKAGLGEMVIEKLDSNECLNAWVVSWIGTEKGYGPLLYDVAIEWSSQKGGGLTPDRTTVSQDAKRVWAHYYSRRGDVQKRQLDNPENELTPQDGDNCKQTSAITDNPEKWDDSPLSKIYIKKRPEMIRKLTSLGKIEFLEIP